MKARVSLVVVCLLVPAFLVGIPKPAHAEIIIDFSSGELDYFADDVTGFRFSVGATDIVVTRLGFFDEGADGLAEAHPVGIYDATTEGLVVSGTVPAGTGGALIDSFRYVDVAPTVLSAGRTYVINAYRPTASDAVAYDVSDLSVSPLVAYITQVAANATGGLIFANTPWAEITNGWFGPNFEADAGKRQAVPVLGGAGLAVLILLLAVAGLACLRKVV